LMNSDRANRCQACDPLAMPQDERRYLEHLPAAAGLQKALSC